MAIRHEPVAHVRSNEPRGARNDYAQISSIPFILTDRAHIHMLPSYQTGMTDTSWIGRAVLALLMAASLTLFGWRLRKVLRGHPPCAPHSGFQSRADRSAHTSVSLGSGAAGEGDPAAALAGAGARFRILGILRLRAHHPQPPRVRIWRRLSVSPAAVSAASISASWPPGPCWWRFPSPGWPCAGSWSGPFGWARSRPNRA